jgi:hypothetical protein
MHLYCLTEEFVFIDIAMFVQFINEYGTTILYAIITTIAGYISIVVKNLYQKYVNDQTKKDVVKTVVQSIEQIYKDLHGEEKLNKALESASEMLAIKGIEISEFELRVLIEAAVGEFNNVFNKTEEVIVNE